MARRGPVVDRFIERGLSINTYPILFLDHHLLCLYLEIGRKIEIGVTTDRLYTLPVVAATLISAIIKKIDAKMCHKIIMR
ncbi:unnamed protein product [Victoria cruziana]